MTVLSSSYLDKAITLIDGVRGKKLSFEEQKNKSIELAALLLKGSHQMECSKEKKFQQELGCMMDDPKGRVFTMCLADQCFRSKKFWRTADQIQFLLHRYGIPQYLSPLKKISLRLFKSMGKALAPLSVPLLKKILYKECRQFIFPGEPEALQHAIHQTLRKGLRINLNHLGEVILGEEEAQRRFQTYLEDLSKPEIEYISIKVSTICSQLNLIARDTTLTILAHRFRLLLQKAHDNTFLKLDGTFVPKFVNLDMEEYRDLNLTVDLFKTVLSEPACLKYSAGIVLQSYLPETYLIQQDLTVWAMQRVAKGGLPIKIRIVKGANLAMEQVEASLHDWPQAPYLIKLETDANFKRMLIYACQKEHAHAAHIGIGSHNLFDIAFGLILRAQNDVEKEVSFEMLKGMAKSERKAVQTITQEMLLYCPASTERELHNAMAYLIRRLDENTGPENFLRKAFNLQVGTVAWIEEANKFSKACETAKTVSVSPRRVQNRFYPSQTLTNSSFENEADTDWSLTQNCQWAQKILDIWIKKPKETVPLVINGKILLSGDGLKIKTGFNPSHPQNFPYIYVEATTEQIDEALQSAIHAHVQWNATTVQYRIDILGKVAELLRLHREDLTGVMIADTGKIITEADTEVSEAIDFVEYYRHNLADIHDFADIKWHSKGPVLIASPWNFPCSIPTGSITAALAAGNSVIFKPAPESVWVGWVLVQLFWQAGIQKDVLQFINCEDEPFGTSLMKDPRVAAVALTGSTSTAQHFLKIRPDIDLIAETGGKNAIIVSNLADRDQAIKDIIQSAFGHAGQKCSACSLVICVDEVYDDMHFQQQLRDAAASLPVGIPWNPATRINPLIRPPGEVLRRALTQLEEGEEWLLEPKQNPENECLWSPGIKRGVRHDSFTYANELFGPVLGLMRADNLDHAIQLVNQTNYGLTSGLHSLDLREQKHWSNHIEAGNCYINRGITGAIVQRQPFGGWKDSSYSPGAKAGGPNYVMQFMHAEQIKLPKEKENLSKEIDNLGKLLDNQEVWLASAENYMFYWKHYFSKQHDPSLILGEDNFLRYKPRNHLNMRILKENTSVDILRAKAAALICGCNATFSSSEKLPFKLDGLLVETDEQFINRLKKQKFKQVRFFSQPEAALRNALATINCYMVVAPVLANGRIELLHYLKEQSLTVAYHCYGNLGEREGEARRMPR